jgi:hypothetical protein
MAAVAMLALTGHAAMAFPPSAADRRDIAARLLESSVALRGAKPDAARARRACNDARAIARRSDANDLWSAQIEDCLATVDDVQDNAVGACDHYAEAAEKYAKVRNDPDIRSVDADIERTRKARVRLACPGTVAAPPAATLAGGPPAAKDLNAIVARTTGAHVQLFAKDAKGARSTCEEARRHAARFAPTGYAAGIVEECFADVASFENDKPLACTRYGTAATHYAAARPGEPGATQAARQVERVKAIRAKLGC